jgi:hypothetical protein
MAGPGVATLVSSIPSKRWWEVRSLVCVVECRVGDAGVSPNVARVLLQVWRECVSQQDSQVRAVVVVSKDLEFTVNVKPSTQ